MKLRKKIVYVKQYSDRMCFHLTLKQTFDYDLYLFQSLVILQKEPVFSVLSEELR